MIRITINYVHVKFVVRVREARLLVGCKLYSRICAPRLHLYHVAKIHDGTSANTGTD